MAPASLRPNIAVLLLVALVSFLSFTTADKNVYIEGTDASGVTQVLAVNRYPALYTGNFGDCLGGQSLFNITKFDAAYYADNLTVVIHLDGVTSVKNESLMLHIEVDAYGESRYEQNFDPCSANIYSLCPLNASIPVTAWVVIQVSPAQVSGIPSIAFSIPDFEGLARLQIFANSSQTQIGCFQAVMRNGNSFSQPEAVSPILGIFTLAAILSSFATAIYGVSITHIRTHYAHSFSVLIIFETFQSMFFSGALSVNWPSVLPAWWSNFAWSAGLIASSEMVSSLNPFDGVSGNASQVGGAGSTIIDTSGGIIQQIYGRSLAMAGIPNIFRRTTQPSYAYNASDPYDYTWAGYPVQPGMPLPGSWEGFAGNLIDVNIPAADAFMLGFIWLTVAVGLVIFFICAFKFSLDFMAQKKWIREDRLAYFRTHMKGYLGLAILRTMLISFFSIMTLALLQFNLRAGIGPTVIAAIVFALFLVSMGGIVAYALHVRLRHGKYQFGSDTIVFEKSKLFTANPSQKASRLSKTRTKGGTKRPAEKPLGAMKLFKVEFVDNDPNRATVHKDEAYIKRFGWLSSRYRRTRWWFFACWLGYQLIRACFIGGCSNNALAQVFGLFIVEILAFVVFIKLNPFEGSRNTSIAIWMLGISKVVTTGLSIAFLPAFNLDRILATVLGVIIIVVQGLVVIAVMILVVLGAISSWMSLTRNREEFPEKLDGTRIKYFEHLQERAPDLPADRATKASKKGKDKEVEAEEHKRPQEPYFSVNSVRRAPKIEDEDEEDDVGEMDRPKSSSVYFSPVNRLSRANSISSITSLPRAARAHRASWSSRDFSQWQEQLDRPDSALSQRMNMPHTRSNSLRAPHLRPQASLPQMLSGTPVLENKRSASLLKRPMTPAKEFSEEQITTSTAVRDEDHDLNKASLDETTDTSGGAISTTATTKDEGQELEKASDEAAKTSVDLTSTSPPEV